MNIMKQIHRERKIGKDKNKIREIKELQTITYKINSGLRIYCMAQGYIIWHSQYFIITKWNKICKNFETLCCTTETNIINQLYFKK